MCGFPGELSFISAVDRAAVERMAATLASRGPDGEGSWHDGPAALAHRYFPVPALSTLEGATLELVRDTLSEARVRARGVFRPEHVRTLLAAPNDHLTTLEGSKLWQLALLELWLEAHDLT